jgi:hypothetical protein
MKMNKHGTQMASFAELLANAMKKAKIRDKDLVEHIALEDSQGEGISERRIARWRRGEKNNKGDVYKPKERKYILAMIKPLGFSRRGQRGLEECNNLLRSAEFWVLDEDEQNKYFPRLKFEPPHKPPPFSCFAYDNYWVGRDKLLADLSVKVLGDYRVLILVGITGIGKTALGEKLAVDLQENWAHFDRVNFDDETKLTDFSSVATDLLTGWGEPVTPDDRKNTNKLLSRLVKRLRVNQHLLLVDSLENILIGDEQEGWSEFKDEWWPKLFQSVLAGEDCQSTIILTSQDLPAQITQAASRYQNFFYPQVLRGLEGAEQLALFGKTGLDVGRGSEGSAYLKRIAEAYEGHPLALRTIAGEIGSKPFNGNVLAYWNRYANEIEEVEKAIEEAKTSGKADGADDKFNLHKYTRQLRTHVRTRLEKSFERLERDVRNAYLLLCLASVYRCAVLETFWLSQLEDEGCDDEQQKLALDALRERYLVEEEIDHHDQYLLRQHNLIRSVALECLKKLDEEDE